MTQSVFKSVPMETIDTSWVEPSYFKISEIFEEGSVDEVVTTANTAQQPTPFLGNKERFGKIKTIFEKGYPV